MIDVGEQMHIDFDEEFASAADYARMFRELGFQVVPSFSPREAPKAYKRPALNNWREYQNELVDDATFDSWFAIGGAHVTRTNIGILTGKCSGNLFVVDLDEHKGPEAGLWWGEMLDRQERAGEIEETVTQITGGGGRQIFFRAPDGWTPPTSKSPVYNVDIRGQGGFVVTAPSKHASGRNYEFVSGLAPHECEVAVAPRWFCDELDALFGAHVAADPVTGQRIKTPTPDAPVAPFGGILDGREEKMTRMVWGRVLDMYRECPIGPPSDAEVLAEIDDLHHEYVNAVASRLPPRPGVTKAQLLEEEGRGYSLMISKFRSALRQWDGKVAREAALLPPKPSRDDPAAFAEALNPPPPSHDGPPAANPTLAPIAEPFIKEGDQFFEVLSLKNLMQLPDPKYLIDGLMIESGLTFIFGAPGCGKSFIAMGMALSVAARLPQWWGRNIEHSGPVIYLASEGISDMKFRVSAWCKETGVPLPEETFHIVRKTINFTSVTDINKLAQTVGEYARMLGENPVMVVVDTVSRSLPGVDENQQKDMTIFIKACDFLRETFGMAVVGVHHEGRATGQMRGSTVMPGAADQIFHVKREKGSIEGVFIADKIKSDADGWEWPFLLRDVDLPPRGMKPCKSLFATRIFESSTGAPSEGFGGQQETGVQIVDGKRWPPMETCREIVNAIGRAWHEKDPWGITPQSRAHGKYAPHRISDAFNVSVEVAEAMVNRWLRSDVLIIDTVDTKTKRSGLRIKNGL